MEAKIRERAEEIRDFSRFYTNFLGLVNQKILKTPYSLAEARVLLEIEHAGQCTAKDLSRKLNIDPGYLSRMLARFIRKELVSRWQSSSDARAKTLSLTEKGKQAFRNLSEASTLQISDILKQLPDFFQDRLVHHTREIKDILSGGKSSSFVIRTMKPGDIAYIAYRHAILYQQEYALTPMFEQYVLHSLVQFLESKPMGNIWVAEVEGNIAGFIGIVATDKDTAQLRWFGLGRRLMEIVLDYCRKNHFKHVFLWTFSELEAARHLYGAYGFVPTEKTPNDTWKEGVIEERWDLSLNGEHAICADETI
jgi:DNA-binding MarR family transcriptional regulator/GNAT superfamily N-acetyltransferase